VVRRAPARPDPAAPFEPVQCGVERALADVQRRGRDLVQPFGNRPAVLRLEGDGLEDEQVERALWKLERFFTTTRDLLLHQAIPSASTGEYHRLLSKCKGRDVKRGRFVPPAVERRRRRGRAAG